MQTTHWQRPLSGWRLAIPKSQKPRLGAPKERTKSDRWRVLAPVLILKYRLPPDVGISKDVVLVGAATGKLRHHGALGPGLEPVQCIGRNGVLLARPQRNLVKHGVVLAGGFGDLRLDRRGRLAFHIKPH